MDPAPQPTVLGEFRIRSVLGEGGSGVVYDATWGPRRVALKVLHPTLVGTGKERAQFLTEAQRLQQIMHPSVVKVLAVGQLPDGRPYLAMERLEGETLASVIARGALPPARALEMFSELCGAVHALHEQGLVHRDLKPENVFVVEDRHAVLLDFGIAKDLDAPASTTTQEGNVRGTPAYMAPERFFGQAAGIATDVYELALVLYAMLAGRLPWDHVADPEARLQPRSLCELAPVSEALDVEIRRALSTRAQNRPPSAVSLLDAVRTAANESTHDPEPAETARLRSGAHANVAPQTDGSSGLGRAPGGGTEQRTPLAWAPTEAAPKTGGTPRKRWRYLPVALAIAGVAGAAVAIAFAMSSSAPERVAAGDAGTTTTAIVTRADAGKVSDPNDPWADRGGAEETKAFALVEDPLPPEKYRAELAAALPKLPNDARLLFAVQLSEMRAVPATRDFLDALTKHPKVAALGLVVPPCVKALASEAEWILFGAEGVDQSGNGTLIVRGRWRRLDVEACFADTVKTHVSADGAKLFRIGDDGWMDFIDDHTAYVTLRTKLDAEGVHKLVKKGAGPTTRAKKTFAALPAARTVSVVVDGATKDDWSMFSLPRGTDIYGWIRVERAGIVLDLAADPHNDKAATAAQRRIQPQLDELFANTSADAVGKLEVVRQHTAVHLRGNMTSLMLGIVTAGLSM
ncbi:MAG TPA: serine/threonine-protein kinase [Kofleriaceae bacterium]